MSCVGGVGSVFVFSRFTKIRIFTLKGQQMCPFLSLGATCINMGLVWGLLFLICYVFVQTFFVVFVCFSLILLL